MRDFNRAAAERPWRKRRGAEEKSDVRDLLPGATGSNIFVRSIALADRVQTALASAATATGHTPAEMRELFDRLNGPNELSTVSPVSRAEMIRVLAQRRSINEIEAIAPELGKLSTMHASDIVRLAGDFDALLHLAGWPATESERVAAELHTMSACAGLPLSDTVQAFGALLGDLSSVPSLTEDRRAGLRDADLSTTKPAPMRGFVLDGENLASRKPHRVGPEASSS